MIKKIQGKYVVLSEKTGRSFGSYTTKSEAEHRLGQVEMFKHMKDGVARVAGGRKKKIR
jgi:predicted DNA-binding protein